MIEPEFLDDFLDGTQSLVDIWKKQPEKVRALAKASINEAEAHIKSILSDPSLSYSLLESIYTDNPTESDQQILSNCTSILILKLAMSVLENEEVFGDE